MRKTEKVLILTCHFSPSAHVGAKRIVKFSKYLPQYGWTPIVISRKISQYHLLDETLNEDLPSNFQIYRVGLECKNKQKNQDPVKETRRRKNFFRTILIKVYIFFIFFDYFWVIQSFLLSLKTIRKNNIKVVFTTFPNAESHLVGLLLKVFTRRKWICEFRDPWTLLHNVYQISSVLQKWVEKYIERLVLKKSDYIITVGENFKDILVEISSGALRNKISVIYNGYDVDDFNNFVDSKKQRDKFVFAYLGIWGSLRTPEYFLRALKILLEEKEELKEILRVNFIGGVKFDPELELRIIHIIQSCNLNGVVNRISFLTHKKALERLYESDVQLLVVRPGNRKFDNYWVVTSKLFEYLYVRKPILALAPPMGEVARIIRQAGAGEVVHPENISEISNKIWEMYSAFKKGQLKYNFNESEIKKYDRMKQTGQLVKIFNTLLQAD